MKQRIISAIIMIIILVPLLIIGKLPFTILMALFTMLGLHELLKLNKKLPKQIKIITYLLTILLFIANIYKQNFLMNNSYFFIFLLLVYLSLLVFVNNSNLYNYKDAFYLIGITFFVAYAFSSLVYIRSLGLKVVFYLLLISTMTDIFALLIGKKFGKHKLAPKISPNKTVEGLVGGTIIGSAIGVLFYNYLIGCSNILVLIIITLVLSLIGSLGDLIKSSIKRYEHIKDFSNLIPGHGGILDRFDSIIFISLTYILISSLL